MKYLICSDCGEIFAENEANARAPEREDGFSPWEEVAICPVCGSDDLAEAAVCSACGEPFDGEGEDVCPTCREKIDSAIDFAAGLVASHFGKGKKDARRLLLDRIEAVA